MNKTPSLSVAAVPRSEVERREEWEMQLRNEALRLANGYHACGTFNKSPGEVVQRAHVYYQFLAGRSWPK